MDIFGLCVIAVTAAILSITVKKYNPESALLISFGGSILIMVIVFKAIMPFFNEIERLYRGTGLNSDYGKILIKCLGICIIVQIASDTCKDAGENALASKVEIAGRAAVILIALPMFSELINIAIKLIGS